MLAYGAAAGNSGIGGLFGLSGWRNPLPSWVAAGGGGYHLPPLVHCWWRLFMYRLLNLNDSCRVMVAPPKLSS